MSTRLNRHRIPDGEFWTVESPWYIDLAAMALLIMWMVWTYACISQYGPRPVLIGGAVVIALVVLLALYGQRVRYFRIGQLFEIDLRTATELDDYQEHEDEKEQ